MQERGLTLVELLLAGTIASLILATILGVFSAATRRWQVQGSSAIAIQQGNLALDRLRKDLRATLALTTETVGTNLVYTLVLPAADPLRVNGVLTYTPALQVRYYRSDLTGALNATGGTVLWRATAPVGTSTWTPDTAWSLASPTVPYCPNVQAFSLARLSSAQASLSLTVSATEGKKTRTYALSRRVFLTNLRSVNKTIKIDTRGTYLLSNNDAAMNTIPLDLHALGIVPGDMITLQQSGIVRIGWEGSFTLSETGMMAVFSGDNILLALNTRFRIPGALSAESAPGVALPAYTTKVTWNGGIATDIPEDFWVDNITPTTVMVPAGARYLFVAFPDDYYADNNESSASPYSVKVVK